MAIPILPAAVAVHSGKTPSMAGRRRAVLHRDLRLAGVLGDKKNILHRCYSKVNYVQDLQDWTKLPPFSRGSIRVYLGATELPSLTAHFCLNDVKSCRIRVPS